MNDCAAIRRAIDLCDIGSAKILARPDVSWVGVYPFMTEGDYPYLKDVAQRVSAQLEATVFGFMVPQGAEFCYVLCENGRIVDEFRLQKDGEGAGADGNADVLLEQCVSGTNKSDVEEALQKPLPVATEAVPAGANSGAGAGDKTAIRIAKLLGIPRAQLCTGYNHLKWAQAGR
ncbi:MAG TPA: hypothetical protein V6C81_11405 [Planktothrix sp.]